MTDTRATASTEPRVGVQKADRGAKEAARLAYTAANTHTSTNHNPKSPLSLPGAALSKGVPGGKGHKTDKCASTHREHVNVRGSHGAECAAVSVTELRRKGAALDSPC